MQAAGIKDDREDAIRYYARLAYPTLYNPNDKYFGLSDHEYSLIAAYYDNGSKAIDSLIKIGLKITAWKSFDGQFFPDYFAHIPENKAPRGRGLVPIDPQSGEGITSGAELVRQLKTAIDSKGIQVLLNHKADRLITNSKGEVTGIEVIANNKTRLKIRSRKAVIFGSGGFTQNQEMRLNYLRGPVFGGCAVRTNEGDFVYMATALGAQLENMNNAWWNEAVLLDILKNPSPPMDVFFVPGDSMIQVDKYGNRIVNEKFTYNERTQVHFEWDPVKSEYKNLLTFMIYDERTADIWGSFGFAYPIPPKGVNSPSVISANTFEELTKKIETQLASVSDRIGGFKLDKSFTANLKETVSKFNKYAMNGVDLLFHRGETPIEIAFHGPAAKGNDKPNPTMYPLSEKGPYYAIILTAGTLDTKGGPKINNKAQVLNKEDKPIKGLYGAGNCIGSPAGQAYWAAGGTIGPAITFGYIAGINASKETIKK